MFLTLEGFTIGTEGLVFGAKVRETIIDVEFVRVGGEAFFLEGGDHCFAVFLVGVWVGDFFLLFSLFGLTGFLGRLVVVDTSIWEYHNSSSSRERESPSRNHEF
jgi:hypothetical protein